MIEPPNPTYGPQIKLGVNDTFKISIGTVGAQTYTIVVPWRYYTLNSLAGTIQTLLNALPTGNIFQVVYGQVSPGYYSYSITDTSSTATEVYTLDFSTSTLGKTLGFQQQTYGTPNPSAKYQAETTNLADNVFGTTIVTLPQGFYDFDRMTTTLQNQFPFSGGSLPGDSTVYPAWTITGDDVTNFITFDGTPQTFPEVQFVFNSPHVTARSTNTLLGFSQNVYGNSNIFTSDQEINLTKVSNLVLHIDCPARHVNQVLDNYVNSTTISNLGFFKHSNVFARIPVDCDNGSLISFRSLTEEFTFELGVDRLQNMRIWLTDEYNSPLAATADTNWNAVIKVRYLDKSTQDTY